MNSISVGHHAPPAGLPPRWTPQRAALLARYDCRSCRGTGLLSAPPFLEARAGLAGGLCTCVFRRVFRVCYRCFRLCATADRSARTVTFSAVPRGVDRHLVWIRRNEDYCADFQAAGRRVLTPELYRVFRFFYLLGGSADLVARRLGVSRATLYRMLAQIEPAVGRELALLEPYSLYPPQEYMRLGAPAHVV